LLADKRTAVRLGAFGNIFGNTVGCESLAASNSSPRRTPVKNHPGVYYRQTPNGRRYEITFIGDEVLASGKRKRHWQKVDGYDNLDAADAQLAKVKDSKRKGESVAPVKATFGEVAEDWFRDARLGGWTRKNYRAYLDNEILPRFGSMRITKVGRQDIGRFVRELEERGLRKSSVENYSKPMRCTFKYIIEEADPPFLSVSPFAGLSKNQRPKDDEEPHESYRWTDAKLAALYAASDKLAAKETSRYDYTPILKLAAKAGPRLGECLGLDWPDCHLIKGEGFIRIERQWTRLKELRPPKWGSRRKVGIADDVVVMLAELKMKRRDKEGPVFASPNGGRLSHRNIERRAFHRAAEEAGLEGCTLHDLRHASVPSSRIRV
jgi:integrase